MSGYLPLVVDESLGEAFETALVHVKVHPRLDLLGSFPIVRTTGVSSDEGGHNGQSSTGLQLGGQIEQVEVAHVDEFLGPGHGKDEQQLGPPVLGMGVLVFDLHQRVLGRGQGQSADAVSPLLFGSLPLDVLVDQNTEEDGDERVVPVGGEHDEEAEAGSEQGQRPVVVAEARTPVGCPEERVQGTDQVDEGVAHEEEEVHYGGDVVHSTHEDGQLGDDRRNDQSERTKITVRRAKVSPEERLVVLGDLLERCQKGDDLILRNGLKQTRGRAETLEGSSEGGEERADEEDPLGWPR